MRKERLALSLLQITLLAACAQQPPDPDDGAATGAAPTFPCPPGALETGAGCEPAGVPPGRCGSGFASDGAQGCVPVLPEEAGPPGQMAVPGETAWREVAPCGADRWGGAPIDETTEFVDAAYAGTDSDGTEARPWSTIQDAVDHAAEGALVAIAEGSYVEDLLIWRRPVRLWGRCPALVEVVGPTAGGIAVQVDRGASGTEIHDLAVRGQGIGLGVRNAHDVVVERVWIHDTSAIGLVALGEATATSLTVRGALVEHTTGAGMVVTGAAVTLEGTVLRDIDLATGDPRHPLNGHAMAVQVESFKRRASVTARSVVIERVGGLGIRFSGADGVVEDSVVRDVAWLAADLPGAGLTATHIPDFDPGTLTVRGSVLERNHTAAIAMIGVEATLEATVVRDTGSGPAEGDPGPGMGLYAEPSRIDGRPSRVALRHVLVERSRERGVVVNGSDVEIDGLLVRDLVPGAPDYGAGIEIAHDQRRANVRVRGSAVEGSYGTGIAVFGADAALDSTVVRDTRPLPSNQDFGRGVNVQSLPDLGERGSARLHNVLIERNSDGGLFLSDSDATVESTTIADTLGRVLDGTNGCGIIAYNNETGQANVLVRDSVIERSAAAGIYNFGATVQIASTTFTCEPLDIVRYVDERSPAVYEDLGGNVCGCEGRTIDCRAEPTRIEPPRALPPPPPLPESEG
ncbi:right-handed parallel beta-helix repeat-containing protein [Sorangium sp. So ce1014]|uniref:right-handed parallel beta-helix repeat-containing protein n=1 Tax=Sorangium sp. So ce1014 TaxID=3133326 RepID=UPI003F647016